MAEGRTTHTWSVALMAGLAGAGIALLVAPRSGRETRAQLKDKALDLKADAEDKLLETRDRLTDTKDRWTNSLKRKSQEFTKNDHDDEASEQAARLVSPVMSSWEEEV